MRRPCQIDILCKDFAREFFGVNSMSVRYYILFSEIS